MNHRERIHAALHGLPVDHMPVALWRHFPNDDLRSETLAARVVEFQRKHDFDFVKVTPASGYPAEMYGATFRDKKNREGTREYIKRPVNVLGDWERIIPLGVTNPIIERELAALRLIRQQLGEDVPILQTIFSPLNSAHNLAGEQTFSTMRTHSDILHRALKAIAETTALFANASLRAGADAIFYATQMATSMYLDLNEFKAFGEPYDLQVLESIRAVKPEFILLHIHGLDIYFDALTHYPVQAINWHDRRTAPSLKHARQILSLDSAQSRKPITLVGGIDEWNVLAAQSCEAVIAQARDAIMQVDGRGFILAAGCVIPVDTVDENVQALVQDARA